MRANLARRSRGVLVGAAVAVVSIFALPLLAGAIGLSVPVGGDSPVGNCSPVGLYSAVGGDSPVGQCCPQAVATYLLTATPRTGGSFTGLFCVNANGDGTYVQFPVNPHTTGPGHVKVMPHGVITIQASGATPKVFSLVGTTNGKGSSFSETGTGLTAKTGTFTLTKGPA